MKSIITALVASAVISSAGAATIVLGGGTNGLTFLTDTGVLLSPSNATIQVGSLVGNTFTQFAPLDPTQPTFATTGVLAGKWSGNASDNAATADIFNGQQVWFKIDINIEGITGTAFVSQSGQVFPNNASGVGDSLTISSQNLDVINESLNTVPVRIENGQMIFTVVPEPSAFLLGVIGAVGLVSRRKR